MQRRTLLKGAAAGAVGLGAGPLLGLDLAARARPQPPFAHGVASGDPLPDRVVIWTRVAPTPEALPGSAAGPAVQVRWVVAEDPGLHAVVRRGSVRTDASRDHTVKVDVGGLQPDRRYFYGFAFAGRRSPVGSTKTAPALDAANRRLRFALASCSNFEGGHFSGYRGIGAREDLDFVLHVGDYIYEYAVGRYGAGPDIDRRHRPETDIVTLADYRRRYACYREDADLRAAHQAHPFISIWDDHEVANDNWAEGAENHDPETQGTFRERFDNASRAYREWLPVREDPEDPQRLYRRLEFGSLATLHMIDSRTYRSEQTSYPPTPETDPSVDDPDRTLLGRDQKEWLKAGLSTSAAAWQLIGNPQMITPVLFPPLPQELTGPVAEMTGLFPPRRRGLQLRPVGRLPRRPRRDPASSPRQRDRRHGVPHRGHPLVVGVRHPDQPGWVPAHEPVRGHRTRRYLDHLRQPRRDHRLPAPDILDHRRGGVPGEQPPHP